MSLPTDAKARKEVPIATGVVDYFPDALAAVAELSHVGNEQHNLGKPLHWDRSKSGDESDALMRHFVERGKLDTDGVRHSAKVAWRALALLQKEIEAERRAATYTEFLRRTESSATRIRDTKPSAARYYRTRPPYNSYFVTDERKSERRVNRSCRMFEDGIRRYRADRRKPAVVEPTQDYGSGNH